jgi:hypothetical protein
MDSQSHFLPRAMDAKACFSSYVVLCSIWVLLAAVWTYINVRSPYRDWRPVWICILVALGLAIWLQRFRLTVTSGLLKYQTLFATRSIRLVEIERAKIETFHTGKGSYQAVLLYSKTSSKPIKINTKVFSRSDITKLFDILGEKLHSPRELGIFIKEKF